MAICFHIGIISVPPMNCADVMKNLRNLVLPPKETVLVIIEKALSSFLEEQNLVCVPAPVNIIGDLHGQFFDFLNILDSLDSASNFLFLGDYVDRGYNSVELFLYLLCLKLQRKDSVYMLRGNHESRAQTSAYGFKDECIAKYDEYVYWRTCELFEALPIAAIAGERFFSIHGGIMPEFTLEGLLCADRLNEYPEYGNIMWGDPSDDVLGFLPSQRGAGYLFGRQAVQEFLEQINIAWPSIAPLVKTDSAPIQKICAIVRSHQLVMDGIKCQFDGTCITVWSAPNYCYKCKNKAAAMIVKTDGHEYMYYQHVKEQYKVDAEDALICFQNKS